ncbi:MAG TPA: RNA 2',3'-cyclic phosphodiesterase [Gemmatimonadaceae bacterium]
MRLFIAINLPSAERRAIAVATAAMRKAARAVSWVNEERLHLTLEFLGEQPESAVEPLRIALAAVTRRHAPIALALKGLGAFPNLRAPRIVWMGVVPDPKLELLQHDVALVCATLGYERQARAFRPHITIGRARSPLEQRSARALTAAARAVNYAGAPEARTVDIMASQLLPSGPRYSVLAAVPLGEG